MRSRQQVLAVILGAIVGAAAAGVAPWPVKTTGAHIDLNGHTMPYSYSTSNCAAGSEVDPTTIIFYNNAGASNVHYHAKHHGTEHHGTWSVDDNGQFGVQYFYNHYCGPQDGEDATQGVASSRYHHRHFWYTDTYYGTYSLSTPHWEDVVWPECGAAPQHAVRENGSATMPEGGFNNGKLELGYHWHDWNSGGREHFWLGYQVWNNTRHMKQCDEQEAWADGNVDYIEIR